MKKQFTFILAFLLISNAQLFAQNDSVVTLPAITVTSTTRVSNELNNAFTKTFPDAMAVRWYKLDKDYLAKFIENDMNHNSLFKKNGRMVYDISFGYQDNLPEDIRKTVESSYSDFKINRAINVKEGGRDIWVVNLEGMNNYVIARVEDNQLEEVERFKKAD